MTSWHTLPTVVIRQPTESKPVQVSSTAQTNRVLQDIGKDPLAIDTEHMSKLKLKAHFKDFDPEKISASDLSTFGAQLYKLGLIDNHTAELMSKASDEFDKNGLPVNPDKPFNALEFFASRISSMQDNSLRGDPYAKMLLRDYVKAVHVLQNLHTFATTGDSYATMRAREREKSAGGKTAE